MTLQNRYRILCIAVDLFSSSIAVALFNIMRYEHLVSGLGSFASLRNYLMSGQVMLGQIVMPIVMVCIYAITGYYNEAVTRSRMGVLLNTFNGAFFGTLVVLLGILINDLLPDRATDYALLGLLFGLLFAVVYVPRYFITRYVNRRLHHGDISFPTIIVGYSSAPNLFREQLKKISPLLGARAVLLCDAENRAELCGDDMPLPVVNIKDINDHCSRLGVSRLILIPHPTSWNETLSVINRILVLDRNIFIAADSLPPYLFNTRLPNLVAEPYIDLTQRITSAATMNMKRMFDVVVSSMMLLLTSVPVLCLAGLIKLTSSGPAFFKQKRVGRYRKYFTIYKLRTMAVDAEQEFQPALSHRGDLRVTPLGRVLRKYHLDELPQFWNVLRGDMSIVGPRPERSYYIEQIMSLEPAYTLLLRIRPGITSLGMVKFGYATTIDEMVKRMRYDLLYMQNMSIVTDVKVLLYTVQNVFSGKGV